MIKEARYVIRLSHPDSHKPSDQPTLLKQVRTIVHPLGGKAINLRVSRLALEFDLFCPPDTELHPFLTALEPLGRILTYKRLDVPPPAVIPAQVIAEARTLFNEERYWEAHEVLEAVWKPAKGSEKQLLQGLILTAAALVHAQKAENTVAVHLLEDAAKRLADQPATYFGLDVRAILRNVKKMILTKIFYFPSI